MPDPSTCDMMPRFINGGSMKKNLHRTILLGVASSLLGCASSSPRRAAQPPEIETPADDRFLEQYALTRRFTAGQPNSIKVTSDGSAVLFLRSPPRSFVQDLY